MTSFFSAEVVASASKLRYAGRGRGKESPVHPEFYHLCALVDTHGRNYAQKLIKKIEEVSSLIADSLPAQKYDEYFGFAGLRNGLISLFTDMFPDEVEKFRWDTQSVLQKLNFERQVIEETLDNRFAPEPWTAYVSSLGRSRASVRPWRSKPSRDKDLLDTWQFLDHEVIVAERVASRESGEISGWVSLRVTRITDFGRSVQIIQDAVISVWDEGKEEQFPLISLSSKCWLDWIDRKIEEMPNL